MKRIIATIGLLCVGLSGAGHETNAQVTINIFNLNDVLRAKPIDETRFTVQYQTTSMPDTLQPDKKEEETLMLKVGDKCSVYYSYAKFLTDSVLEADKAAGASQEVINEHLQRYSSKTNAQVYSKYSINSLVYWVTYVHNVVYSFYRSMIYCYINSTQRCAGSIVIDIIPTNGADKRKFFPFAPYFPVTNVIKRYFYPYFPAIIGIKGYSFPYFPYLSGIMKIKTALYSLFSRLDWHKTVVFPCLGEIYEGIRSLSWEIPVT
ncbi:hypothetical protein NXW40_05400 [Parabacteroides distasonis]|nr:hypothetical protein NXW40_05400 [Parabacteroides distasonis]